MKSKIFKYLIVFIILSIFFSISCYADEIDEEISRLEKKVSEYKTELEKLRKNGDIGYIVGTIKSTNPFIVEGMANLNNPINLVKFASVHVIENPNAQWASLSMYAGYHRLKSQEYDIQAKKWINYYEAVDEETLEYAKIHSALFEAKSTIKSLKSKKELESSGKKRIDYEYSYYIGGVNSQGQPHGVGEMCKKLNGGYSALEYKASFKNNKFHGFYTTDSYNYTYYRENEYVDIKSVYNSDAFMYLIADVPYIIGSGYNLAPYQMDVSPVIVNGTTYIPARALIEYMGGTVIWNDKEKKVTLNHCNNLILELTLDNNVAIKNGEKVIMDTPAKTINGRTMLPLRFVAETLDFNVEWNGDMHLITIIPTQKFNERVMYADNIDINIRWKQSDEATEIMKKDGYQSLDDVPEEQKYKYEIYTFDSVYSSNLHLYTFDEYNSLKPSSIVSVVYFEKELGEKIDVFLNEKLVTIKNMSIPDINDAVDLILEELAKNFGYYEEGKTSITLYDNINASE